ncbi:MAG: hypothetical protein FWE89_02675 [Syntrophaceae bacterium]|nr:hypothetical protein [Syntrophaceae bacterium]
MIKLKQKGMKWLRLLHILTASVWFGGVVCIWSLVYTSFFQLTESEFLTVILLVPGLYQKVILPFALLTVIQGIAYGLFTNWGFVKYKWILSKWILAVLVTICTGLGGIRQIHVVVVNIELSGFAGGFADGGLALLFISLQIIFMVMMIILSVFKPMKRK